MTNRCNPKSAARVPKRPVYITALPPAVLAECRATLERQMAASTKGGRPRFLKGRSDGGVLTGVQREKIRQANIARGIARRATKRALAKGNRTA